MLTSIFHDVAAELDRQRAIKGERFKFDCSDPDMTDAERSVILGREYGEVLLATPTCSDLRKKILDARAGLRDELIQVAAVAISWVKHIDQQTQLASVRNLFSHLPETE